MRRKCMTRIYSKHWMNVMECKVYLKTFCIMRGQQRSTTDCFNVFQQLCERGLTWMLTSVISIWLTHTHIIHGRHYVKSWNWDGQNESRRHSQRTSTRYPFRSQSFLGLSISVVVLFWTCHLLRNHSESWLGTN